MRNLRAIVSVCLSVTASAQTSDWRSAPGKDFPLAGGNLANQRYSSLTGITPANISQLGGAWMLHVAGGQAGGNLEGTPVVVDGVMYLPTGGGVIMALDAATGAVKWKYQPPGGGRGMNRGVVVAEGRVFSAGAGTNVIARVR